MSQAKQNTDRLKDRIDPKLRAKAARGVSMERKQMLAECDASLQTLDALGVEVPHRDFNPEDAYEYPTTVELDGTKVHLHQDVREDTDDEFGDFGSIDTDEEEVIWTVVDLCDETVTLTVVGDWSKRRNVPFEDFPNEYEPITCTAPVGEVPRFGY